MKNVTNGAIGEGGGLKFGVFAVTPFLNGPLAFFQQLCVPSLLRKVSPYHYWVRTLPFAQKSNDYSYRR